MEKDLAVNLAQAVIHMAVANTIVVYRSKSKLTNLAMISVLFIVGGSWIVFADPQTSNAAFNNAFVKAMASYGSIVMGVLGLIVSVKRLFDKKPALIIDSNGILDNSSVFNIGLIPWSDISGIYGQQVQVAIASNQGFITIAVFDPEKYILKEKNLLKRKLLQANLNGYGSPIHLSTNAMKLNHIDLLELLTREFEKYKPDGNVSRYIELNDHH